MINWTYGMDGGLRSEGSSWFKRNYESLFESVHIEVNIMKNDIQWEITAQVTEKYAVLEDLIADTHGRNTMSK